MRQWEFTNRYSGNPIGLLWGAVRLALFLVVAVHLGWSWLLVALVISYVELEFGD